MTITRLFGALLLASTLAACNMVFAIPDRELDESCGKVDRACCEGFRCGAGAVCDKTVCVAIDGACNHDSDCSGGKKCAGPTACGPTVCLRCSSQVGGKPLYDLCTSGADCQSGVCDLNRRCTIGCRAGATGDAECAAALGAGSLCTEFGVGSSSTPINRVGVCAKRCSNDADCAATGEACIPNGNFAYNRIDLVCRAPKATGKVGDPCKTGDECRSNLCNTTRGACTTFCKTDADCSTVLPRCTPTLLDLPKDGTKTTVSLCGT
jgi:hypothetical protein